MLFFKEFLCFFFCIFLYMFLQGSFKSFDSSYLSMYLIYLYSCFYRVEMGILHWKGFERKRERERERANSYAVVTWPGTRRRALPFAVQIVQRMLISSYRNVLVRFHSCCVCCFQMFSALLSLQVNTVDFLSGTARTVLYWAVQVE